MLIKAIYCKFTTETVYTEHEIMLTSILNVTNLMWHISISLEKKKQPTVSQGIMQRSGELSDF